MLLLTEQSLGDRDGAHNTLTVREEGTTVRCVPPLRAEGRQRILSFNCRAASSLCQRVPDGE